MAVRYGYRYRRQFTGRGVYRRSYGTRRQPIITRAGEAQDVVKSIGVGKDYTTIAAFIADLDVDAGFSGNNAIGEIYGDHSLSSTITIDATTPNSVTLRANAVADRHDGIQDGAGATVTSTVAGKAFSVDRHNVTFEWFRLVLNGSGTSVNTGINLETGNSGLIVRRMAIYGDAVSRSGASQTPYAIYCAGSDATYVNEIHNNFFAFIFNPDSGNLTGTTIYGGGCNPQIVNNSMYYQKYGVEMATSSTNDIVNNLINGEQVLFVLPVIATDHTGTGAYMGKGTTYSVWGFNVITVNEGAYLDITQGSANLHYVAGNSAGIGDGTNATAYITDSDVDIDDETRPATWDLGADQYMLYDVDVSQTLPSFTHTAVIDAAPDEISVTQTLPALTHDVTALHTITGVLSETLPAFGGTATGEAQELIDVAQTLPVFTHTVVLDASAEEVSITQTLPAFAHAVTITDTAVSTLAVVQTLPAFTQLAILDGEKFPAFARLDWVLYSTPTRDTTGVRLDGVASGTINLVELGRALGAFPVASVPSPGADYGLYEVTAGGNEGLYFSNGVDVIEVTLFP